MRLIPPGAEELFIDHHRGRVRVLRSTAETAAQATPLLLVHGGGTDSAAISWFEMFSTLGPRRAVYAMDLPGFGYTEIDPLGGPAAQATFAREVADALALDRVLVVGVSMGGDIALNLALQDADRVGGLVLIAPGGLVPRFRDPWTHRAVWLLTRLPDPLMDPVAQLGNRFVDTVLRHVVKEVTTLPPQVRTEFAREARRHAKGMGYRRYNQATIGPTGMRNNLLPLVDSIVAPTLFFHGTDDPLVSPKGSREATRRMPRATLVLVPDCGHWAHLEARDRFFAALDRFLTDVA